LQEIAIDAWEKGRLGRVLGKQPRSGEMFIACSHTHFLSLPNWAKCSAFRSIRKRVKSRALVYKHCVPTALLEPESPIVAADHEDMTDAVSINPLKFSRV